MYRIGQLNRRLVFECRSLSGDGMGGYQEMTQPSYQCWGSVRRVSAKESVRHQATGLSISCIVVVRNTARIKEYNTVVDLGLRYNIVGKPTASPRDLFLELEVELIDQ